jgi:DNA-binding transcriptional ArsR family regulator
MSLQQLLDEDRRLVILRCLEEASDYSLNENLVERMLVRLRLGVVGRDIVRAHLAWLEQHGLVTVDKLPAGAGRDLWVGTLTKTGQEVAQGRPWPGVARPAPGG